MHNRAPPVFHFNSIDHYHSQLQDGSTTCVAAVEHYLGMIRENQHLNAYVRTYDEEAMQRAASLDADRRGAIA